MKKIILALLAVILLTGLLGCGSQTKFETVIADGYSYEVPEGWVEEDSDYESKYSKTYYYSPEDRDASPDVLVAVTEYFYSDARAITSQREQVQDIRERIAGDAYDFDDGTHLSYEYYDLVESTFGSNAMVTANHSMYRNDEELVRGIIVVFFVSPTLQVTVSYMASPAEYDAHKSDMDHVINSVKPL